MTHNTRKTKILMFALGLVMCLALMPGIAMASPTFAAYAAGETEIDTLSVAFNKVNVGESLDAAFDFENATNKTLKVPAGANYTATLVSVSKNGQGIKLWDKDDASLPWSRVETQSVEQNVAYCIRVRFKTNDGYKLIENAAQLRSNMQVSGAELGKGNDIELWDSAGMNSIATIVDMDLQNSTKWQESRPFRVIRKILIIGKVTRVLLICGKKSLYITARNTSAFK